MNESAPPAPIPLWRLLQATSGVVAAVRAGQSASAAIPRIDAAIRPGVQALSFEVLRHLGRAEALRQLLAKRAPPPEADALLCTALALAWRGEGAPYPAFTLVDQAVEAAKRQRSTEPQGSFINACLRRFLRERDELVARTDNDPVARWNHPAWWIARLRRDHPQQWQAILEASNEPAPMTLRVNVRRATREQMQQALADGGCPSTPVGGSGLVLQQARPVPLLPGFADGRISVQDAGAQLAAPLLLEGLGTVGRPRILDACAAPGGKTAHLLEAADADVVALDIDPARCDRIRENLARLGLAAQVVSADAGQPATWWDGRLFDAILLDAPCTASGIVRRHPDVRWLRRPDDVDRLAALQTRLLEALWPLLAPGGRLVYCTCSVFRAEGDERIRAFVAHHKAAVLRPSPGHLLPQRGAGMEGLRDNLPGDHDGFFYAVLQKPAEPAPGA